MRTLSEPSFSVIFTMFFGFLKATLLALVLIVAVLIVGQSRVAPVSVNLLTAYALEFAVHTLSPLRPFFPQPYTPHLNIE